MMAVNVHGLGKTLQPGITDWIWTHNTINWQMVVFLFYGGSNDVELTKKKSKMNTGL